MVNIWFSPMNYSYGNNKFETGHIQLMGFIQHFLMSLLQTVCPFLFFPSPFSFLLCPYSGSMNFEEAGSSILELLRGFNAHSVQVQRGWPFLAPLVDKHLLSRSFPALNIFREEFQFEGTGHKCVKQSSSLGPCQLLPESFISKLMR